ncbi:MAG TPA: hypothetical protein VMN78_09720 [Longimicrobiales bacterium]|nr:hypothetical protein [Longimicrobiales bacterium]
MRARPGGRASRQCGQDNLFGNLDDALNYARRQLGLAEEPAPANVAPTVDRERVELSPRGEA